MRRRTAHLIFGAIALIGTIGTAVAGWRLHQGVSVNRALAQANVGQLEGDADELRLARALKLAHQGEIEAATELYKALSRDARADIREIALYNLGNLYLRESVKAAEDEARALPLIELAKESYRDVLRRNPAHWDARYNLERALWIAPEVDESPVEDRISLDAEERVMSTIQGTRIELP